ncbi:MAG: methyltransferase domain-containing protein [Nocardioidaceae bacterium]
MKRPIRARVGADGVDLTAGTDEALDVLFDDRRVFSIAPQRPRPGAASERRVPWPAAIRPYLRGRSEVVIREHISQAVIVAQEVEFDETDARVRVVDDEGFPLAVSKWGSLSRTFDVSHPDLGDELVDDLRRLLTVLNDELDVPGFVAYGTLLGAVRGGSFIAHDNDADIAYLSRFENPSDIARESFALQRALVDRGWTVVRRTGAFIKVSAGDSVSSQRTIDVFTAYYLGDTFTIEKWIRTRMPRAALTPLSRVSLEGVTLPAPGRPEEVLAATYGPSWRVPDPSFHFPRRSSVTRRSNGWFGGRLVGHHRWNEHARTEEAAADVVLPSSFARWVEPRLGGGGVVVDVGCGTGHDTVWFARTGRAVVGVDYAPDAIARATGRARQSGAAARFEDVSLYDLRAAVTLGARTASRGQPPTLYARLLLDALRPEGRSNLWLMARAALSAGGHLFLEFRTAVSATGARQKPVWPFVTTLDPEAVRAEITPRGGTVEHYEHAVDTHGRQVCRMVTAWTRATDLSTDT